MGKLDGKVAIVTGGSRGQGASHVRRFVEEGAKVVFSDILADEGVALAKELGENAKFVRHDVTKADEWKNVIDEAESTFGPVNILVNNAGIVVTKKFDELTEDEYRKVVDINQVGVFLGMKTVLPSMKKAGDGSIINVSSINGLRGAAGNSAYDSSKFAVRGMTKSAALEFAEYGIRVNSVHPGVIQTPMIEVEGSRDLVEQLKQTIPMQRTAQPEEVSKLILFLASEDSSYSTGSEFVIDGGVTASN
ncbi:glucose 1-dehydrogenase [Virgibacillus sp. MSP4-1]|uniref:glucose 1-dehydrogenase n=1 Tax=Virgibacillus sp. MSP4-1 TaxID=2700081 RepID=UPI00039CC4F7|nr:glucose 1-dehydrogenase [Virgibacillus sp. MSP4-1]QHS23413.1 glucose 1-dehydrogenase [Virgibacillus sp. MSP4-1]